MMGDTARNDSVAVGVTAVEILAPTYSGRPRSYFYIRNSSTAGQTVTLVFGDYQTITAGVGIVLLPTGIHSEATDPVFECWQGRVWAIADAAAGSVSVVER